MQIIKNLYFKIFYLIPLFFLTGCNQEDIDKGWAGDNISKQMNDGTLKIIDFLNVFMMFIGFIIITIAIHDLFVVDINKTRSSSSIAHVLMGILKFVGGIMLLCIKPIAHSILGS